jgi:hypothetical protein
MICENQGECAQDLPSYDPHNFAKKNHIRDFINANGPFTTDSWRHVISCSCQSDIKIRIMLCPSGLFTV